MILCIILKIKMCLVCILEDVYVELVSSHNIGGKSTCIILWYKNG